MPTDDLRDQIARALFVQGVGPEAATAWDAPGHRGRQRWWDYADAILPLVEEARADARAESWAEASALVDKAVAASRAATLNEIAALAGKTDDVPDGLLDEATDAAYRAGIAVERERCAQIAEGVAGGQPINSPHGHDWDIWRTGRKIAAAIRTPEEPTDG